MPKTNVKVRLIGEDGNSFAILARVKRALKDAGYSADFIREYLAEATRGNYDHLLYTTSEYVEIC